MEENSMQAWLRENGLVIRICDGAITICDGDCERCMEDDEEIDFDYEAEDS